MKPDLALLILSELVQRLTLSHAEAFAVNTALQALRAASLPPMPEPPPAKPPSL
jgi:hypothetical protein